MQAQIHDQCTFQAELQSELVKLEKECVSLKSMSRVAEDFWDGLKRAKSSHSRLIFVSLLKSITIVNCF